MTTPVESNFMESMKLKDAAEYLQISQATLHRWIRGVGVHAPVPARKMGAGWRFDRAEVEAWVRAEGEK